MDTDSHRFSKLSLRQPNKAPQSGDIVTRLDLSSYKTFPNPGGDRPGHLL
ncbi:MAG TPA: hypothetical protein VGK48_00500 [Terriglobia bacterium]|jgi:hypothetical protein